MSPPHALKKKGPAAQRASETHIQQAGQSVVFNSLTGSYSTVKTRRAAHSPHAELDKKKERDSGKKTKGEVGRGETEREGDTAEREATVIYSLFLSL